MDKLSLKYLILYFQQKKKLQLILLQMRGGINLLEREKVTDKSLEIQTKKKARERERGVVLIQYKHKNKN